MRDFVGIIQQDEDGRCVGEVPELKACYSEGATLDELVRNIREPYPFAAPRWA